MEASHENPLSAYTISRPIFELGSFQTLVSSVKASTDHVRVKGTKLSIQVRKEGRKERRKKTNTKCGLLSNIYVPTPIV
jgi:hypothetical protein